MTCQLNCQRPTTVLKYIATIMVAVTTSFAIAQPSDHDHGEGATFPDHHMDDDHWAELSQIDHENHEHNAESHSDADNHAGHGHDDRHQEHAGHDHGQHEDERGVQIEPTTMQEFGIVVHEAGPGTLSQMVKLSGEVVFNADRIAHVTPTVSGIVRQVYKSEGDRVEAEEVMAILSSQELAAARSEYLAARARLELAKEMHSRDERMLTDRIGTQRQVLESQQTVREASIAMDLAEQSLHALGQDHDQIAAVHESEDTELSHYELRSPLDGIVIIRHLTRGEGVNNEPQHAPFLVADLSSVWVNLTVYRRDLALIRAGMPVWIEFGHGIPDAKGHIAFVSQALEPTTRTATARVVLENTKGQWRPGLFVTAQINTAQATATVVVPRSALTTIDGQTVIFIQTSEGFEPQPVRTGRMTHDFAELTDGLQPGQRYVARNVLAMKAELNRAALEHAGHAH